tara:strand:- start:3546 stop:3776 length:231 start_codon:yes stop_codon:yes gene_type:complete
VDHGDADILARLDRDDGLEQLVIAGIRVERRVQIDQVDTLGRDTLPQDGEVVAIIQLIPARCPLRVPYAGIVTAKG